MLIVADLNQSEHQHLLVPLMAWFKTEQHISQWGGPDFRFPFTAETFATDAQLERLISLCLLDETGDLLAFGQCYNRLGCCHLARLVIAPEQRGKGLALTLIDTLADHAQHQFEFTQLSLFVLQRNTGARRAYEKQDFFYLDYPAELPDAELWSDILYMRKSL